MEGDPHVIVSTSETGFMPATLDEYNRKVEEDDAKAAAFFKNIEASELASEVINHGQILKKAIKKAIGDKRGALVMAMKPPENFPLQSKIWTPEEVAKRNMELKMETFGVKPLEAFKNRSEALRHYIVAAVKSGKNTRMEVRDFVNSLNVGLKCFNKPHSAGPSSDMYLLYNEISRAVKTGVLSDTDGKLSFKVGLHEVPKKEEVRTRAAMKELIVMILQENSGLNRQRLADKLNELGYRCETTPIVGSSKRRMSPDLNIMYNAVSDLAREGVISARKGSETAILELAPATQSREEAVPPPAEAPVEEVVTKSYKGVPISIPVGLAKIEDVAGASEFNVRLKIELSRLYGERNEIEKKMEEKMIEITALETVLKIRGLS